MRLSKDWYKVNVALVPSKLCYLFFTARASYQAFMILFLMDIGLSAEEASLVNGLHYLGFLFGGPILAFIADKYRCHYKIANCCISIGLLAMIIGPLVSVNISNAPTNYCKTFINLNETIHNNSSNSLFNIDRNIDNNKTKLIAIVLVFFTISSMFGDSILGFVDAATVSKQAKNGKDIKYCLQRLFEPLGWQCGVFLSGLLVSYFPKSNFTCYTGVFVSVAVCQISLMVCLYFLYRNVNIQYTKPNHHKSVTASWKMVLKIFKSPRHVLFLSTIALLGTFQGIYVNLTFLFLKALTASNSYMTWYAALASVSVILFHLLTPLLYRFTTNSWLLLFAISMAYFFRYFTFWVTGDLNILLLSAVLQGFHALFVNTIVHYVQHEFPIEIHSTVFNIANALIMSFGYVASNLLGVTLYKLFGGKNFFFYVFILAFVWSGILLLIVVLDWIRYWLKERRGEKKDELKFLKVEN